MAFTYGNGGGVNTIRTENSTQEATSVTVRDAREDALKLMEGVSQHVHKAARKELLPLPSKPIYGYHYLSLADVYDRSSSNYYVYRIQRQVR